jgi:hypothetical protein
MNPITIFSEANGLNTKVDPRRIRFDPATGVTDLAVAVNINIDSTGRVSRRKGFAATARTENIHSLWCDGGACLFVTGTSLCTLGVDYSYSAVATVTFGARVRYFQLDAQSYWMNGFEKGYVEDGVNNSWDFGTYVGPDTTRQFSDPPLGHIIAYDYGHVFVAQGAVIWYSEPFSLGAFDLARSFLPFEDRITMMRPLLGGMWVSTERQTFFLPGRNPRETGPTKTADYPAIESTDTDVDLSKIGSGELNGIGAIWTTPKGICLGTPEGQMINLTQRRLNLPIAVLGAGVCFDDRYVSTLQP